VVINLKNTPNHDNKIEPAKSISQIAKPVSNNADTDHTLSDRSK